MHIRLSAAERAQMKTCVCPRKVPGVTPSPSARTLGRFIIGFVILDGLLALFLPLVALIIFGIIFAFGVFSSCWYLIRGHSLKCALLWGFAGWILFLVDGIIGSI
ncbi:MAG TPA: hypothetical protein VD907_02900 [Verrucomicrobiae bacterium]|nr:hypothetical protein [Verrucomicrobiae bacterium]